MKKRELEMLLQGLEGFTEPRAELEQYPTPASIAADLLYTAHGLGDIAGRRVIDLGCGPGILGIGAALLGAERVTALDIDPGAANTAARNARKVGVNVDIQCRAVTSASGRYDTCLMNPPFGSQNRHADRPFLEKAAELAQVVYGLHNPATRDWLLAWAAEHGMAVTLEKNYKFNMPHTFHFHRKEQARFGMLLLRMVRT